MKKLNRRDFIYGCGGITASVLGATNLAASETDDLDAMVGDEMLRNHIPGLAVSFIKDGELRISKGFGWADIERRVAMTPDTVQNIGSVSKSVVTTIVMQCAERGYFSLDDDINDYLSFAVRNPNHPDKAITVTQLLTHHSSVADGSSYGLAYECGNSKVSLHDWIEGYFSPDGAFYEATENFHSWAPGERYQYNNVAFAVLAYLVQVATGTPFEDYCQENMFAPLGMTNTSWLVANIDNARHATPYAYVSKGEIDSPTWGGIELGLVNGEIPPADFVGLYADCIYDNPNFADGFLRTSVSQLANFQRMLIGNGRFDGQRILANGTMQRMFSGQGITWHKEESPGNPVVWGHNGGDPGVSTLFEFQPETDSGVVIFANTHGASLARISTYLFSMT